MRNFIFFDGYQWEQLFPITLTRPTCHIRIGTLTIQEKWEHDLGRSTEVISRSHLSGIYQTTDTASVNVYINGAWIPQPGNTQLLLDLKEGQSLWCEDRLLAHASSSPNDGEALLRIQPQNEDYQCPKALLIEYPEHIFLNNGREIEHDYIRLTKGRASEKLSPWVQIIGSENQVFIESGAEMPQAIINVKDGPVYIGAGAVILEGSVLRGPLSIGSKAVVKMGAKLYGETTIGPHCKVGGEVKRSILTAYSNKSHDGYLGDSVIGAWCNFGAGSNNSNMKNTYGLVQMWDMHQKIRRKTGEQFCGLMMGDHSKCGINTQFNTGSVVGVYCNILDKNPENYIPSFSWGSKDRYDLVKALEVASKVFERKGHIAPDKDMQILKSVYQSGY